MSRGRYRHWCETCHGHVGPGSPCAEDEDDRDEFDPDDARDRWQDAEDDRRYAAAEGGAG